MYFQIFLSRLNTLGTNRSSFPTPPADLGYLFIAPFPTLCIACELSDFCHYRTLHSLLLLTYLLRWVRRRHFPEVFADFHETGNKNVITCSR